MKHLLPLRHVDAVARAGSIRKAAERLAITSTALNRRILAMEEELGVPIFERLPGGVRLSTAGELFVMHARGQIADMERLRSRIADLSGERRGHVSIVAGHACLERFLPAMIADYRRDHPAVTFSVRLCNRHGAEPVLADYRADIAMVYEGDWGPALQITAERAQAIHLLCRSDHPLAGENSIRLRDCLDHPMALPTRANGVRMLLERAAVAARADHCRSRSSRTASGSCAAASSTTTAASPFRYRSRCRRRGGRTSSAAAPSTPAISRAAPCWSGSSAGAPCRWPPRGSSSASPRRSTPPDSRSRA